jgi:hypothetical protein
MTSAALTPRQAKFVECYALDRNAARAARSAGYSVKGAKVTGCQLLTNPNLKAALAAKEAELAVKLEIDRDTVVAGIFSGIASARMQGEAGTVIRGWCEVAKITGLDKPPAERKSPSGGNPDLLAKYESLSDEELIAIAEGRMSGPHQELGDQ